jgi:signal transduction histidine kinase/ActR/RegA family two-component response regulator
MTTKPAEIRAESHTEIGAILQRDAGVIIQRWATRATEEQPSAARAHHNDLIDHLPIFLWELGRSLGETGGDNGVRYTRPAHEHGDHRWDAGWSLPEVVRDYQILRIVLVEYLEETLGRALRSREHMALGVALDDAISSSISAYVQSREKEPSSSATATTGNDSRNEFLAVLGHELRNPLAPIRMALQVIPIAAQDPSKLAWACGVIDRQVRLMTRLVDDLLDISRVTRGKVSLVRERVDLAKLVRETTEDRRPDLTAAGLTLETDIPPGSVWTLGDSSRLGQVVGNLLANAHKFTDRGGTVTVRLSLTPGNQHAVILVRDTGVGIDPAFLPRLFDSFMQADRTIGRSRGGLGLGLALVKALVELHGGEVRAASEGPGRGAEFTVMLPLLDMAPPPTAVAIQPSVPQSGKRVLVIDDHRDTGESLKMLLELSGHQVTVALNGTEGIQIAKTACPDVVFCDLDLPGTSGYDVCAALRQDPATRGVILVAVSGHGSPADQERCRAAGFDQHLLKPVEPSELERIIMTAKRKES